MNKLKQWWSDINSSLWFVPTLMVVVAMLLAYGLVMIDDGISHDWVSEYPLLFGAGADGARGMLSAIASSMITVAGLIFSLTLSTLAQVSSQYTPRLLRNFMRDRANQVVMGFFVGIFVYCLMVLRTIRGGDEGKFIPSLAVAFGLFLALVSIGMLIFFIHHIASSVQAANIIAGASEETYKSMQKLFPTALGEAADAEEKADLATTDGLHWYPILARTTGYVQGINNESILEFAKKQDGVIRMEHTIGSFVAMGDPLVSVALYQGDEQSLAETEETIEHLNDQFSIGHQRTLDQDAGFGIRQIVDIALKALSPGINDTTTAIMCIDHLGGLISYLANRQLGSPLRTAGDRVRVIANSPDFDKYVSTAFDQIRTSGADNVAVHLRTLTAFETVIRRTSSFKRRQIIRRQCERTLQTAEQNLTDTHELQRVRTRQAEALRLLNTPLLDKLPA